MSTLKMLVLLICCLVVSNVYAFDKGWEPISKQGSDIYTTKLKGSYDGVMSVSCNKETKKMSIKQIPGFAISNLDAFKNSNLENIVTVGLGLSSQKQIIDFLIKTDDVLIVSNYTTNAVNNIKEALRTGLDNDEYDIDFTEYYPLTNNNDELVKVLSQCDIHSKDKF
jgi:hypothetical protein